VGTGRVEAFSDGVIAVIITIMVLDLKVPQDATSPALAASAPGFAIYALSFAVVGIFWINHHHLLQTAVRADAKLLWSNLGVLFVLSIVPFVTAYVASAQGKPLPLSCYAVTLALASAAFVCLGFVVSGQNADAAVGRARFRPFLKKGATVATLYLLSVPLSFVSPWFAYAIFIVIPILYVLPDRNLAAES
jgi:uncharacterized membrane protein